MATKTKPTPRTKATPAKRRPAPTTRRQLVEYSPVTDAEVSAAYDKLREIELRYESLDDVDLTPAELEEIAPYYRQASPVGECPCCGKELANVTEATHPDGVPRSLKTDLIRIRRARGLRAKGFGRQEVLSALSSLAAAEQELEMARGEYLAEEKKWAVKGAKASGDSKRRELALTEGKELNQMAKGIRDQAFCRLAGSRSGYLNLLSQAPRGLRQPLGDHDIDLMLSSPRDQLSTWAETGSIPV